MKIKLIAPRNSGPVFWDMQTGAKLINRKFGGVPLALPTLAALTPDDIRVEILDENIEPIDFSEKVDLVGITFNTPLAKRAYEIAAQFRNKGVTVVAGGMHASALPEEALLYANSVVVGEAEGIWKNVLDDYKNQRLEKVYSSEIKPDLNNSPLPRWELTKYKFYNYFTVQTSRGCPFNCEFCSVKTFFGEKIRYKPIDRVIEEIKFLQSLDPYKQFIFSDDNITIDASRTKQLCESLIALKIRNWWGQAPIWIYQDEELLDLMYRSGCRQLLVGLETIIPENLSLMGKDKVNRVEDYKAAVNKIQSHGIAVSGCFILGNDYDDKTIFKKVYDFIDDVNIGIPQITILTPLPATRLYGRLEQDKRIFEKNWSRYTFDKVCFKPKLMDVNELQDGYYWLMRKIYSYQSLYKRLNNLWAKGVLVRNKNTNSGIVSKGRIFVTIKILLSMDFARLSFSLKALWNKSCTSITSVLMSLSVHDYVFSLPKAKGSYDQQDVKNEK